MKKTVNDYPNLVEEWDFEKNDKLPEEYLSSSPEKVWWKCKSYGHSFFSRISDRTYKGSKCPYCSNRKILPGFNDFQTKFPELAAQWSNEKNYPVKACDVFPTTAKKYWLICTECGKEFKRDISQVTRSGLCKCNSCTSKQAGEKLQKTIVKREGSLAEKNPELAKQWFQPLNGDVTPNDVTSSSAYNACWKCPDCGLVYRKRVCDRTNGVYCPECSKKSHTSVAQYLIYLVVKSIFPKTILSYRVEWLKFDNGYYGEIDIYVPDLELAIEYDGDYWHNGTSERELQKTNLLRNRGIKLIRFRDETLPTINDHSLVIKVSRKGTVTSERLIGPLNALITIINKEYHCDFPEI